MKQILKCPSCMDIIAISKEKLYYTTCIAENTIDFPQGHITGEVVICKKCGDYPFSEILSNWEDIDAK